MAISSVEIIPPVDTDAVVALCDVFKAGMPSFGEVSAYCGEFTCFFASYDEMMPRAVEIGSDFMRTAAEQGWKYVFRSDSDRHSVVALARTMEDLKDCCSSTLSVGADKNPSIDSVLYEVELGGYFDAYRSKLDANGLTLGL